MKYNIWLFGTELTEDYIVSFVISEKSRLFGNVVLSGTTNEDILSALKKVAFFQEVDFFPSDEIKVMRGKDTFVLFWDSFDVPIGFLEPI